MGATTRGFPYADLTDPADAQASMQEIADFLQANGAKFLKGTLAARPAPSAALDRTFYLTTDAPVTVFACDSGSWINVTADLALFALKAEANIFTIGPQQIRASADLQQALVLRRGGASGGFDLLELEDELGDLLAAWRGGGAVQAAPGNVGGPGLSFAGDGDTGVYRPAADQLAKATAGLARELITSLVHRLRSDSVLGWSSGDPASLASDTVIYRRIADVLKTDDLFESAIGVATPILQKLTDSARSFRWGAGSPEGAVIASPGSVFLREDPPDENSIIYVKNTGAGNTGWKAVSISIPPKVEAKATPGSDLSESVTWTAAFAATPAVVALVNSVTHAQGVLQVTARSTTGATVGTFSFGGSANAQPKHVIATSFT